MSWPKPHHRNVYHHLLNAFTEAEAAMEGLRPEERAAAAGAALNGILTQLDAALQGLESGSFGWTPKRPGDFR